LAVFYCIDKLSIVAIYEDIKSVGSKIYLKAKSDIKKEDLEVQNGDKKE
jgi:hypothetical protein